MAPRRLQQSTLGPNSKSMLVVIGGKTHVLESPTPSNGKSSPTGKPAILELPDELLEHIVQNATSLARSACSCAEHEPARSKACVKALSLVCQRINHIAQPLLYRKIKFEWPVSMAPPSAPVTKLHRSMMRNVSLRKHVRFLSMHIPDIPAIERPEKYMILNDFSTWLTSVRCLSIHGGFEGKFHKEHTWRLITSFATNMKRVKHISFSREGWGLYLAQIVPHLSHFPKLEKLDIHGISEWKGENPTVNGISARQRTAPITSLSLSDYEECPRCTASLILWPKALTHFQFGSFYNNRHIMDYPMFESWLLVHSNTLKSIDIGYLSNGGNLRLLNATLFPNLERLKLNWWQHGRRNWQSQEPYSFTSDDANVLGPKLKCFGWDFTVYDQHSEPWNAFGENEEAWLNALVKTALSQNSFALRKIDICFNPDHYWDVQEEDGYPWDRMDRVRDELCNPNGIEFVYSKPIISREEWREHLNGTADMENADSTVEQDVHELQSDSAESEIMETFTETGYHGEDIRKYFSLV